VEPISDHIIKGTFGDLASKCGRFLAGQSSELDLRATIERMKSSKEHFKGMLDAELVASGCGGDQES
jgi:hypothetical protein